MPPLQSLASSWLVVVDMQRAFLDPDIPWALGENARAIVRPIQTLIDRWGPDRTIFTRYIARDGGSFPGSWGDYFRIPSNSFYNLDCDHPIFDIIPEFRSHVAHCVSMTTFNKWGDSTRGIRAVIKEPFPSLVVTGVSTECCVWSTAAAAAEAGAFVSIVRDACAASDSATSEFVFENVVPAYGGLVSLTSSSALSSQ